MIRALIVHLRGPGCRPRAWARRRAGRPRRSASLRRRAPGLAARRPRRSRLSGSLSHVGRRAAAPVTTIVTSPRTPSAAHGDELGERAAAYLLVGLGQLAADRGGAVVARTPRPSPPAPPRCGAAPRRRPSCAPRRPAPASRRARSPALRGRKPSKQNRSTGRPETASAVSTADGPGHRGDRHVGLDRRGHQPVAGVGDAGHPRVGHQQHPLAGQQRLEQHRRARGLVALEVGHHPAGDGHAQVGGQPLEPAGVLGGHHVGVGELLGQPGRRVLHPPDRGRGEDEDARARCSSPIMHDGP